MALGVAATLALAAVLMSASYLLVWIISSVAG